MVKLLLIATLSVCVYVRVCVHAHMCKRKRESKSPLFSGQVGG